MRVTATAFPLLSLPIEIKNREFIGKALLAAKAIDQGWAVVLGKQSRVCEVMAHCPPAVHIEVSIPEAKKVSRIQPLVAAGHRIGCLCEEGVVYPDGRDYCQRKVGEGPLSSLSYYFANGQRQFNDIMQWRTPPPLSLAITGNPRFDLLHASVRGIYAEKVQRIRARYGDSFVLLNTNFSVINSHPAYGDFMSRMRASGKVVSPEQERIWGEYLRKKRSLFDDYQQLVRLLHARGHAVVIRPHPSEDQAVWKRLVSGMNNVHVIHDDSANAWMLAAAAIIQSGCTTGLEAYLLDRPLIAYMPEGHAEADNFVNSLGLQASTADAVLDLVDALLLRREPLQVAGGRDLVRHHIANAEQPTACDRMLALITASPPEPQSLGAVRRSLWRCRTPRLRRLAARFSKAVWALLPASCTPPMLARRRLHHHLHHQKFPGLSRRELSATLERFRLLGLARRRVSMERIDTDLYLLYPSGD